MKAGRFAYTRADLTGAYDNTSYDTQGGNGKVSSVVRELLYLIDEDRLLVHDRVVSTDRAYTKKWLLHTVHKPLVPGALAIVGRENAGILQSQSDWMRIENGDGRLDVKRLLSEDAIVRLIGGEGYRYYVESDGLDGNLRGGVNGENFSEGAIEKPWFDNSNWRLEIQPNIEQEEAHFLIALSPSLGVDRSKEVVSLELEDGDASALVTPDRIIVFTSGLALGELSFVLPGEQNQLLLVGVDEGEAFRVIIERSSQRYVAERSGVLELQLPSGIEKGSKVIIQKY